VLIGEVEDYTLKVDEAATRKLRAAMRNGDKS
jgi:hypothetical protein